MNIEKTLKLAVAHHQAGRWVEAHQLYKQVLAVDPNEPDALRLMGQLVFAGGNPAAAAELLRKAISFRPGAVDFHIDLARICLAQRDTAAAIASFERALQLDPFQSPDTEFELARALSAAGSYPEAISHVQNVLQKKRTADALGLLGELMLTTDRVQDAVDKLKSAVEMSPVRADLRGAYAMALQHRGDFEFAEEQFRIAIKQQPQSPDLLNCLGYVLVLRRKLPQAIVELKSAIALREKYPLAHYNLALAFTGLGQTDDAIASYRTALEQDPRFAEAWEGLGRVLLDLRQYPAAVTALGRAAALKPSAPAYMLLANANGGIENLDAAIAACRKAVELSPESADAHDALGNELKWTGQLDAAIAEFRRALELDPKHHSAHSKLVYAMLIKDGVPREQILAEHKEWGRQQTGSIVPLRAPRNLRLPDRRLRVGYISNNFRDQAVAAFVMPIIRSHDRSALEVYLYSDLGVPDLMTEKFKHLADQWRETGSASDEELAKMIRADRVDILVELTGHIGRGRLRALAYRPSPIQISYIGYQGTTGVAAVDYVLTDDWADPEGIAEANYVEKPYRLPESFFVYQPPGDAPMVGPLPAKLAGHVTFGCLNAVSKATATAVRLWAAVMSAVPGSTMIILTTHCEETNRRLLDGFARAGIAPERIQLVYRSSVGEYLRRYNLIDIALDPVPFNGHTTTCDAAWMGCPTVTLSGDIYAHRYGGSVLRNLNLPELVTESEEAYIASAVALANDLDRLAKIRSTLRFTMQDSPITNGPRFTRNLELAYRKMWREWCASAAE
jgi:predicted O-linked N-acetylglucosamine transferase (SPINDLY family)